MYQRGTFRAGRYEPSECSSMSKAWGWTENVRSPDILEEDVRFNVQDEDISQRGQAGPARGGGER
jgi:hypothetical protein